MRILVTGGLGFIGSAVVRHLISQTDQDVTNLDKLTYASVPAALDHLAGHPRYRFVRADVCDKSALESVFERFRPEAVMHLAAETHVDRSIDSPAKFVQTNVVGTSTLLEVSLDYWRRLDPQHKVNFRLHHVSTDEVFGALGETGSFTESSPYDPNSPYSASKAAADHLVRAWHRTFGLPTLISNSSNNYGPYQFPEKLIPLTIMKALNEEALPLYGDGRQVRDWLHVDDHARALTTIPLQGRVGESYNVGANDERRNIDLVRQICATLDELAPSRRRPRYADLITFVADRPGHDRRYALDASKIRRDLDWQPTVSFDQGLRDTVKWYLENSEMLAAVRRNVYRGERLGALLPAHGEERA